MPEEPISSPSAGEGPANTGDSGAPTPSAPDISTLSDRQILDLPDQPETKTDDATVAATPEAKPQTEPGKDITDPSKAAAKPDDGLKIEETLTPVVETEALKAAFKLPQIGQELKSRYYMSKAVEELYPTVGEIREIKQLYPTVQDAKTAQEGYLSFQQFADRFYSKNHQDHEAFFESLREEDPEQFNLLMKSAAALQYKHDRDGWVQDSEYRIGNALRGLRSQSEEKGEAELVEAIDMLYQRIFGVAAESVRQRTIDPRDQKIREYEEREQARTQQEREGRFKEFYSLVNTSATEKIQGNIKSQLEKLLPENSGFDDDFKTLISEKIYDQVYGSLHDSQAFHQKLKAAMRGGAYDSSHKQSAVNLTVNEANLLIAEAAKQIVPKFTRSVIARNQQKLDQIRQTGSRVDVGSGSGYTETPKKPVPTREQLNRMSERDILNADF